jgi:hypothetical protein
MGPKPRLPIYFLSSERLDSLFGFMLAARRTAFRFAGERLGQTLISLAKSRSSGMVLGGVFSGFWCKPECKL